MARANRICNLWLRKRVAISTMPRIFLTFLRPLEQSSRSLDVNIASATIPRARLNQVKSARSKCEPVRPISWSTRARVTLPDPPAREQAGRIESLHITDILDCQTKPAARHSRSSEFNLQVAGCARSKLKLEL